MKILRLATYGLAVAACCAARGGGRWESDCVACCEIFSTATAAADDYYDAVPAADADDWSGSEKGGEPWEG